MISISFHSLSEDLVKIISRLILVCAYFLANNVAAMEAMPVNDVFNDIGIAKGANRAATEATSSTSLDATGNTRSGVQITSGTNGGSATLKFATTGSPELKNERTSIKSDPFTLTLSTPISNSSSNATPISLNGLADSSSVKLEYTNITGWTPGGFDAAFKDADQICSKIFDTEQYLKDNEEYAQKQKDDFFYANPDKNSLPKDFETKTLSCRGELAKHGGITAEEFNKITSMTYFSWGLNSSYGYKRYKYVSSTPIGTITQDQHPRSVSAFIGGTPLPSKDGHPIFVTLSTSYVDKFTAGDTTVLCPLLPSGGANYISCASGATAAKETKGAQFAIGARQAVKWGWLAGWSSTITYDEQTKKKGVDVPLYFKTTDGNANYGIDFGWQNEKSPLFSVSIFAGTDFDIMGH